MGSTILAGTPPIKIGGQWRTPGKGPHTDVEVRVCYALINAPTLASFLDNVELDEFRVTALVSGYRVMLKGRRREKPVVAFFHAETWRDALTITATSLDSSHAVWWPDKYPPAG